MSKNQIAWLLFVTMVMTETLPPWPEPWAWSWGVMLGRVLNVACVMVAVWMTDMSKREGGK